MIKTLLTACIICGLTAAVAGQTITPKVYTWDGSRSMKTRYGSEKLLFQGPGAVLPFHEMKGIGLQKGRSAEFRSAPGGNEMFFIVKNGPVLVELNGVKTEIGRGSVVFVLPGDKLAISNNGNDEAWLYQMTFHASGPSADEERARKSGPSFVMNWNDMVVKPTAKGSTRQLFDRQTAMLNRFDIHVTQLNSGFNSHEPHTHKNEEIILMLDGNAEMQIGTDHQKANGGDVVFMGSEVLHNLTNVGTVPCLYFAIQWN